MLLLLVQLLLLLLRTPSSRAPTQPAADVGLLQLIKLLQDLALLLSIQCTRLLPLLLLLLLLCHCTCSSICFCCCCCWSRLNNCNKA
jgi:hypothetical protein